VMLLDSMQRAMVHAQMFVPLQQKSVLLVDEQWMYPQRFISLTMRKERFR
jgi:hypothetical protein